MVEFEIVSSVAEVVGDEIVNDWLLDASANRGAIEFRVATPWGFKLVEVADFQLTEEMHPDAEEFRFMGRLGRFAVSGYSHTFAGEGKMEVGASEADEVELLTLLKRNQMMTPLEFFRGYPGMMDPSD